VFNFLGMGLLRDSMLDAWIETSNEGWLPFISELSFLLWFG